LVPNSFHIEQVTITCTAIQLFSQEKKGERAYETAMSVE